jgi:hypothetical protein
MIASHSQILEYFSCQQQKQDEVREHPLYRLLQNGILADTRMKE